MRARGYRVSLSLGRRARRWVRQVPPGSPSIRVLCVADIEPELARRLAQGRDDFHALVLDTPSRVVAEIERLTGRARSHRNPRPSLAARSSSDAFGVRRPSRMYLAQPTLVEQQLAAQRSWGRAVVAGAALLVVGALGGMMLGASPRPADSPSPTTAATSRPARTRAPEPRAPKPRVREEPVLSAVGPIESERLSAPEPQHDEPPRR